MQGFRGVVAPFVSTVLAAALGGPDLTIDHAIHLYAAAVVNGE
jgi:hypothetical protein